MSAPLTVGTAGHIDHGKTTLVRALTGCDTDRLAEERRRGISIELGFAELDLGRSRCSLVDVPGHERFVRTMVAGTSGVDMFLLVVAADDGPMPQTLEHLAVLRALGVERGVVALTKTDLVDGEARERAAAACAELLPGAPLLPVSVRSGAGVEELRTALAAAAEAAVAARRARRGRDGDSPTGHGSDDADDAPVLHVDRSFTLAGHGTVVTGTLWSGQLRRGQRLRLLPAEREARVRSLQVHDSPRERVGPHRRVAVNLAGVRREEVARGDVLTVPGSPVAATYRLDAELSEGAAAIAAERRVQVHLGTREAPARVIDLGGGAVQLRLEAPLLARRGDRFVVRRIAPPFTLGGGAVRDPSPPRHGRGWRPPAATSPPLSSHSDPRGGLAGSPPPRRPGPLARRLLAELRAGGDRPAGPAALAARSGAARGEVEAALKELIAAGEAVRAKPDVVYPAATYAQLRRRIAALAAARGSIGLAEARDALGLSRKYAQALLEQLDGERVLRRDGDRHYPRTPTPR